MNFGSKSKKRMVLPSRPDPPSPQQLLEDVTRAGPTDPVFSVSHEPSEDLKGGSGCSDVEDRYLQSRRYVELHERLQEARGDLARQREELRATGDELERRVTEVRRSAL